jgi:hypothetical protein
MCQCGKPLAVALVDGSVSKKYIYIAKEQSEITNLNKVWECVELLIIQMYL